MKTCPNCGELLGDRADQCFNCHYDFVLQRVITQQEIAEKRKKENEAREDLTRRAEESRKKAELELARQEKIKEALQRRNSEFMITTGFDFQNHNITKYYGIVSSDIVLGTGLISEMSASVSDLFGENSVAFQKKMSYAKQQAIQLMKENAIDLGANGLIGLTISFAISRDNMFLISGLATAVLIDCEDLLDGLM